MRSHHMYRHLSRSILFSRAPEKINTFPNYLCQTNILSAYKKPVLAGHQDFLEEEMKDRISELMKTSI